jgi:toxin YoeB
VTYTIQYTPDAEEDIEKWKLSGDKTVLRKIEQLILELMEHPHTGTGKPKQLKGPLAGRWSRRISGKHRLVYRIFDDRVLVLVLCASGHYNEK